MAEYENELQELVERLRPDPQAQINRLERDMSVLTEKASGLDGRISDLRSAISDLKSDFKWGVGIVLTACVIAVGVTGLVVKLTG